MPLSVGDKAPDFSLTDQDGSVHSLKEHAGKWLLIYFYPKDDTPGCTTEACSIRDHWAEFEKAGLTVLGVSTDSLKSHEKFAIKYKLPFPLLADEEKKMVEAYGVWGKKKFMGREYLGTKRWSFLVNPKGIIKKIYEDVKPQEHVGQVLADYRALAA